jgi:hypothetical protein
MAGTPKTAKPSALKHYLKLTLVVLVLAAGVCVAAYFQTEIKLFIKLKAWDKQAPANVVVQFLTAAREGNEEATANYVNAESLKPTKEKGKIVGYGPATMMGGPPQRFVDLLPEGDLKVTAVLFRYVDQGAAVVEVPGKGRSPFLYSMVYTPSGWRIVSIGPGTTRADGKG